MLVIEQRLLRCKERSFLPRSQKQLARLRAEIALEIKTGLVKPAP